MTTDESFARTDLRLLVVMRHGEAESSSATGDEGRELTARGRDQVVEAGRWLVSQGVVPDVVVVSPSTRTRQTWEALTAGGVTAGEVREDRGIYNGEVADLVEVVRTLPSSAKVVVLVGHAPGVPGLAVAEDVRCHLPEGWSPATLGVLSSPGEWDEFPGDGAALVVVHAPDGR